MTQTNLGINYRDVGRLQDAIVTLNGVRREAQKSSSMYHMSSAALIETLVRAGDKNQVLGLINERVLMARSSGKTIGLDLPTVLLDGGLALLQLKAWAEAETMLRESLEINIDRVPDSWITFNVHSALGAALMGKSRFSDAETHLIQGYHGLLKRISLIPRQNTACVAEALTRLTRLPAPGGDRWRVEFIRLALQPGSWPR